MDKGKLERLKPLQVKNSCHPLFQEVPLWALVPASHWSGLYRKPADGAAMRLDPSDASQAGSEDGMDLRASHRGPGLAVGSGIVLTSGTSKTIRRNQL